MAFKMNKKTAELLKSIAAGMTTHVSREVGLPLVNEGFITVDTEQLNPAGDALASLTDKGKEMISGNATNTTMALSQSGYGVIKGAVLPPSKRGFAKGGGAPTQYPFDTMEIGDSFFVPKSEKHPNPEKTLGSTVSSANTRFAVDTGTTKTVTRNKRGPKNKLVLDAAGNKIQETVTLPVYQHTRKFSLRPVVGGQTYGDWTAPTDGVLIARVELKD